MDAKRQPSGSNAVRSPRYGALQELVDALFEDEFEGMSAAERMAAEALGQTRRIPRLDVVVRAESADLGPELLELVGLLPPGSYTRARLCDQLNSLLAARAWGQVFGTVA